jgi:hypothetical protein
MGGFVHGLRGHRPKNALDLYTWEQVQSAYGERYFGFNFSHFREKYIEEGGPCLPYSTYYNILASAGFVSPRANKKKKKKVHRLRERRRGFGELVQMDASKHLWFGKEKTNLHLAIDDATSMVLGAFFDKEETLKGYYEVFRQILLSYGVPRAFYTDRRSVFTYRKIHSEKPENDASTQFSVSAKTLGVGKIHLTSCPQAKGRVERSFGTHQDRLVSEMRLCGIKTIKEANAFLKGYVKRHNERFALKKDGLPFSFGKKPSSLCADTFLSVTAARRMGEGQQIRFDGKVYVQDPGERPVYVKKGTEIIVIRTFDGRTLMGLDDFLLPLREIRNGRLVKEKVKAKTPKDLEFNERRYRYVMEKEGLLVA